MRHVRLTAAAALGGLLIGVVLGEQPEQLDGSTLHNAVVVQTQFERVARLADEVMDHEVMDSDEHWDAGVGLLRAAFKLCPACPMPLWGKSTKDFFYLDGLADRQTMTKQILPALFQRKVSDLLWIGVQPYTLRYEYLMARQGVKMTTLEVTPAEAKYGSTLRHIIDRAQNIGSYVEEGSFDAVILNGVIGWGLDSAEDINATLAALHKVMRGRAALVLGYNSNPIRFPYWSGGLLPLFNESTLGSLPHRLPMGTGEDHHVYEQFERIPGGGGSSGPHARQTKSQGGMGRRERLRPSSSRRPGSSLQVSMHGTSDVS